MNYTHEERERRAYLAGDYQAAEYAAAAAAADDRPLSLGVYDITAGFPAEDAMQTQIDDMRALARNMRGANRTELERIAQSLEDARDEQSRAAEYGAEELSKALQAFE